MRKSCSLIIAVFALVAPFQARAGDLVVTVKSSAGAPVADAVVIVQPGGRHDAPARFAQPLRMAQHDKAFDPFVLVAPVGAEVAFPNEDSVRHQVYSFSPAKKFELRLYGKEEARTVVFDKPGVIALGCNIHDSMSAFIKVVDAPYAVKTDKAGRATVPGVPAGPAVLRVWHPYFKAPQGEVRQDIAVPATGVLERQVSAEIRPPILTSSPY